MIQMKALKMCLACQNSYFAKTHEISSHMTKWPKKKHKLTDSGLKRSICQKHEKTKMQWRLLKMSWIQPDVSQPLYASNIHSFQSAGGKITFKKRLFTQWPYLQHLRAAILGIQNQVLSTWIHSIHMMSLTYRNAHLEGNTRLSSIARQWFLPGLYKWSKTVKLKYQIQYTPYWWIIDVQASRWNQNINWAHVNVSRYFHRKPL